jgi:hypothetical protein
MPKDVGMQLQLGSLSEVLDFPGPKHITKYIVFAPSVLNDFSSPEVIESIGHQLGQLTHANPLLRQIEAPLLGTGAGGLKTEVAGKSLYNGFLASSISDATLYIFVFDSERQIQLTNLIKELEVLPQSNSLSQDVKVLSILFLAADPTHLSHLRLGKEFREIEEQLALSKQYAHFNLALPQLSLRSKDIARTLFNTKPNIVHFSGHGSIKGELCFEDETGQPHFVRPEALAALFALFTDQVNCVLLNACYSYIQAKAIGAHINYVIGMNSEIGDKAAIAFALGFYQALAARRSVEDAYKFGCVQIRLQNIPENLTPVLIRKGELQSEIA